MGLNTALVDRARRVVDTPLPTKVEGTTQFTPVADQWFKCRLSYQAAPESDDQQGGRRRTPRPGDILMGLKDFDGELVTVESSDRLEVDSNELGRAIFEVTADPEPIRKKKKLIGWTFTVTRVEEHPFVPATP